MKKLDYHTTLFKHFSLGAAPIGCVCLHSNTIGGANYEKVFIICQHLDPPPLMPPWQVEAAGTWAEFQRAREVAR